MFRHISEPTGPTVVSPLSWSLSTQHTVRCPESLEQFLIASTVWRERQLASVTRPVIDEDLEVLFHFAGRQMRRDIGYRAIAAKRSAL